MLAIAAQDMENRLRPMPSFPDVHRPGRCISAEIASCGCLGLRGQALDISKRYGVCRGQFQVSPLWFLNQISRVIEGSDLVESTFRRV